ncbi:MAG: anthranilate synthase component I family protein [Verrucomicrobia bacterium]|nr:MAG: anthranilate synthase component I family protein [Verrucomicrobiota bacterium]
MSCSHITQMRRVPALDGWAPIDVAAHLQHLTDFVFFDTAGNIPHGHRRPLSMIAARPVEILKGNLTDRNACQRLRCALKHGQQLANDQGLPQGGLAGWVSYEGDFTFGHFPEMLVYCHDHEHWWEIGELSSQLTLPENSAHSYGPEIGDFHATFSRADFLKKVERIQDWIAKGDIYQVNLSQTYEAPIYGEGSMFGLYEILREVTPAPMAAYLRLGGDEVLSSSPETFLRMAGRGIETHPIKGTRPRFQDVDDDRRSAYELQTSPKEISELIMITDLLRNDLGQICEFGSVEVTRMIQLESLAHVHHLISSISGCLRSEIDALGALAACFPGGSITGAPKKRAMEIIDELEGKPRGIYCGAIGWLGYQEESCFNIAIRTIIRHGHKLIYQVGAGIVADSKAEHEYEETQHKAAGIRLALECYHQQRDQGRAGSSR